MSVYYCESCLTGENKYIDGGSLPIILSGDPTIIYATDFRCYEPLLEVIGNLNPLFDIGSGFNGNIFTITLQSDGKILVGGNFTSYSGVSRNYLIRLNTDGSIDTSFSIGTGFSGGVNAIELQSDGKILVGGNFTSYSGVTSNRIIRLNTNGSIDNSFVIGTGFNTNQVQDIQLQTDGKILVGGSFTSYSGVSSNRIIRLNTDGSIDNSFVIGTGFNTGQVQDIQLQTDGKILVGGLFGSYSGVSRNNIIRLNTDGSVDNSFVIGGGTNSNVWSIKTQSDGKILVGGTFTSYSGVSRNRIIRLNTDGSVDNSFVIGTGFNSGVFTMQLQSDGKILVGGQFTTYSGVSRNYLIRLNTDGSIDTSFSIGTGFNNSIRTIQLQPDGKILVGGDFTTLNSEPSSKFALILEEPIQGEYAALELFSDCEVCNGYVIPISANTPSIMCFVCSGETTTVNPVRPVWSGLNGGAVTQMNAVLLGGNGLNS